jgi:endonuclease/exonuclease/phosphatase family metal-dependent hydrolase
MRMPADSDPDVELDLTVLSRWPLLSERHFRLPSEDGLDTIALLVEADHPVGRLHVATTCLAWEQDHGSQRLAQAHALGVLVNDPRLHGPLPVLLAGDLNALQGRTEIHALTSTMTDCWTACRPDEPGHTYSSSNPRTKQEDWHTDSRIDYVLARAGEPAQPLDVLHTGLVGMDASDGQAVPSDPTMPWS